MKRIVFTITIVFFTTAFAFGQNLPRIIDKPPIDSSVYSKWTSAESAVISNDGKYVAYTIKNQPVGGYTLMLQATNANWQLSLPGVRDGNFSADSRLIVFKN